MLCSSLEQSRLSRPTRKPACFLPAKRTKMPQGGTHQPLSALALYGSRDYGRV